eukprot:CAMPEP_0178453294 /NCGR_PEP_ID=MMETSP0689_2-20121128/44732_1 /TAXON_ID=160604 /ORGANISM="Amphidinium massartii, Strain CS-259" /LENGTH=393 /DNA_ID=CAMNT_0020079119 /DNA_START=67 /DNA_END=1245 /DNA_ORIENTATION=-
MRKGHSLASDAGVEGRVRTRRSVRGVLTLTGIACILVLAHKPRAWVSPSGPTDDAGKPPAAPADDGTGRRALVSGIATAGSVWSALPDEAAAFREDRILNAKDRYGPKMRALYQKLEGLRDDLVLTILQEDGVRYEINARPADWFDGVDRNLIGPLVIPPEFEKCCGAAESQYVKGGGVMLVPRGRCSFSKKATYAKSAGAKGMILYDQRVTKQPEETQGITGAVRSKSMATRAAGDALTGGAALQPYEKGVTIMAHDPLAPGPNIGAAMVNLKNGTDLVSYVQNGGKAEIVRVQRLEFFEGIDTFIKKDLKAMIREMNVFGLSMRASKDDLKDPIVKILEKDQKDFKAAVESKDYALTGEHGLSGKIILTQLADLNSLRPFERGNYMASVAG